MFYLFEEDNCSQILTWGDFRDISCHFIFGGTRY